MNNLYDVIKSRLKDKPIWDYKIYPPLSLEDNPILEVSIQYGEHYPEDKQTILLKMELP